MISIGGIKVYHTPHITHSTSWVGCYGGEESFKTCTPTSNDESSSPNVIGSQLAALRFVFHNFEN